MKKILLSISLSCALFNTANAADGTINFTGNIIADACVVDTASKNMTVNLGDVSTTAFTAAGDKASPTHFEIALSDCPAEITTVSAKFDGRADPANTDLLALDTAGGEEASNVGIEIADDTGLVIPMFSQSKEYPIENGGVVMDFVARYTATSDSVGTGVANGTAEYTINYQ